MQSTSFLVLVLMLKIASGCRPRRKRFVLCRLSKIIGRSKLSIWKLLHHLYPSLLLKRIVVEDPDADMKALAVKV